MTHHHQTLRVVNNGSNVKGTSEGGGTPKMCNKESIKIVKNP